MAVGEKNFFNTFLEDKSEKAFGVNYFFVQEMQDAAGFSNKNEFSCYFLTDDDNALSFTSKLASTALKPILRHF